MRFWRLFGIAIAIAWSTINFVHAAAERRVALVIGNGQYESVSRLPNPKSDAEMVAASLRQAGFTNVILSTDLTREKLVDALHRFSSEAEHADWAVIYYAGHGMEMNGMNYLIPVDARLKTDRDLQFEAVPMSQALGSVEGARKLRLLILDACRDNPFLSTMARSIAATRSIGRGLGAVEPDAGTLVAYAAKHGQVAADGDGAHSPFATALVKHIETPGLEINRLFRRVTSDVLTATSRRQEPFTYGSLPDEDFYFRSALPQQSTRIETAPGPADPGTTSVAPPSTSANEQPNSTPAVTAPEPPASTQAATPPIDPVSRPIPQSVPNKRIASVGPVAEPAIAMRPSTPRIRERPIARTKIISRPESGVVRPKRVAQAVERPEPRIGRTTHRERTGGSRGGGSCFSFNGERVCE